MKTNPLICTKKSWGVHLRKVFFACFSLFIFSVSGALAADAYVCDKIYYSCKSGYYLSAYATSGDGSSIDALSHKDGTTSSSLGNSNACYSCPTGCTCSGGAASPLCSLKITLNDVDTGNGGAAGSGTIYYGISDKAFYSRAAMGASYKITSVTPPKRGGYVFNGYYTAQTGGTNTVNSSGTILATSVTADVTWYAQWLPCTAGYYCPAGSTSVTAKECEAGNRCPQASPSATACGAGKWSAKKSSSCSSIDAGCYGTSAASSCPAKCAAGTWAAAGSSGCSYVAAGYYSTGAGTSDKPTATGNGCLAGYSCGKVSAGYYSTGGGTAEKPTSAGNGCLSEFKCGQIKAGCYGSAGATTECPNQCPSGMTSEVGSDAKSDCKITCAAGYYLKSSENSCSVCPSGFYCKGKTCNFNTANDCGIDDKLPAGYYSNGGATAPQPKNTGDGCISGQTCGKVTAGYYNTGCGTNATGGVCSTSYTGGKISAGYYGGAGATSATGTGAVAAGYYSTGGGTAEKPTSAGNGCLSEFKCGQVDANCYSSGTGSTKSCPNSCPSGMASAVGSTAKTACYISCAAGNYLAKSATSCSVCPGGKYCTDARNCYYSDDKTDNCTSGNVSAGYYSTGGGTSAKPTAAGNGCLTGYSCGACGNGKYSTGGASECPQTKQNCYTTNTTSTSDCPNSCPSGMASSAGSSGIGSCKATCAKGQYLPAKKSACETCKINHYCGSEGTYGYNESNDQGATVCPNNTTTNNATGKTQASDCLAKITLNKNGGGGLCGGADKATSGVVYCNYNKSCTLPSWNTSNCYFINGTKIFKSWGSSSSATTGKTTDTFIQDTTVYAVWKDTKCDITNGTGTAIAPSNNAPKCDVTCNAGYLVNGEKVSETPGNETLSYTCKQITYNITYAGGGNTGGAAPTAPKKCSYGDQTTAPANTYSKTGYTFAGWKCTGGTDACNGDIVKVGAEIDEMSITDGGTITLTATWSANKYTVKYSCGDGATGTPPSQQTATYDNDFTVSANNTCKKQGYHFLNWTYNSAVYEPGAKARNLTTGNGTVTLTAAYEPDRVGCPNGQTFDNSAIKCVSCPAGYYCVAWCMKNGIGDCDYKADGNYDYPISDYKKSCPSKTTSSSGAQTIYDCYVSGNTEFKDKNGTFKISGIKSLIYKPK